MTEDPFDRPAAYVPTCPDCGARGGGHFIGCTLMQEEHEKRRGICPKCHLVRPCECAS